MMFFRVSMKLPTNDSMNFDFGDGRVAEFKEIVIDAPSHDCDIKINLPSGKSVTVQLRPSNADVRYNGSLDIVLPDKQLVVCWEDDDLTSASAPEPKRQHERLTKQICTELP